MNAYQELAALGVATVYEASGKEAFVDCELRRLVPGSRAAGPARTVLCAQDDNLMVHAAIERIEPGEIVVIAMPEPRAVALVGDLLATQIRARGASGVLVDASVRDRDELEALGLPIWSRYVRVHGAAKEVPGALDVPVTIAGARIAPGDAVVLDADGACVVARARTDAVLRAARERLGREKEVRARYERGELSYDLNGLRARVERRA